MFIWETTMKTCKIVELSCPADVNITKKVSENENIYRPFI